MKLKLIAVTEDVKKKLDELKIHRREPYYEVIERLIESYRRDRRTRGLHE